MLVGGFSFADTSVSPARPVGVDHHLNLKKTKSLTLAKGANGQATVEAEVSKKFHVQANEAKPPLIPTTLTLDAVDGLKVGAPIYPKAQPYKQRGTTTELQVYNGTFGIKVPIEANANAKPGNYALTGKLRYQACDETTCYPPVKEDVSIPVVVK